MMAVSLRGRAWARRLSTILACAACVAGMIVVASPRPAIAAPEPSPIPKRWQLEIATSPLRTAVVALPGVGNRGYFFMSYRVTNISAQELLFAPSFELVTNEGDVLRSGRDVPLDVTRDIMSRLDNPLIEDQISIVGTLLRGPENAKYGVVIWPIPTNRLTDVSVYAAGFSGETATVEIPDPNSGAPVKKLLRKTWMMNYNMPGEMQPGPTDTFQPHESKWIMR